MKKKLLLITDAWLPQVNGVVRTLTHTLEELEQMNFEVEVISPAQFPTLPCPLYSEIRLSLPLFWRVTSTIKRFKPDHIHIATEGPLGAMARLYCRFHGLQFSTAFHTVFPEYAKHIAGIPEGFSWAIFRWFHKPSRNIMVATPSMKRKLEAKGFKNLQVWSRGLNRTQFRPLKKQHLDDPKPILLYVGRVSKEKNIEAFLKTKTPGTKHVVGDGPLRAALEKRYPEVRFLGYKRGEELAQAYADADLFVFPSRTDTFGNVILEALASGLPVAAYPEPGPIDLILDPKHGALDDDLRSAIEKALLTGDSKACVAYAREFTWKNCTKQFVNYLVDAKPSTNSELSVDSTTNDPSPMNSPSA